MERKSWIFGWLIAIAQIGLGQISVASLPDLPFEPNPGKLELYSVIFIEENKPSPAAFLIGLEGMSILVQDHKLKNDSIFTLIDYTLPSSTRRLWVIDVKNKKVLFNTLVAHGKNSGLITPTDFSNTPNTNKSSQGFFITGETYYGKHGYSLRLDGIEAGINDKARSRAIVIHSAEYATIDFINNYGRLGRSFGCPALPPKKSPLVIDTIKEKSCLFIYTPDSKYPGKSLVLNKERRS